MNVYFDIDYTILGVDGSLRPYTREVFEALREQGHRVYVWSGEGVRREVVERHRLTDLVADVLAKPLTRYREQLADFGVHAPPEFVVDDHPVIVRILGGLLVTPYYADTDGDRELASVPPLVAAHAAGEGADHPRYRPGEPA